MVFARLARWRGPRTPVLAGDCRTDVVERVQKVYRNGLEITAAPELTAGCGLKLGGNLMQQPVARPMGITLITILLAIHGVIALLYGFGAFGPYPGGLFTTLIQILFGLVLLYLAWGIWTLQTWAWLTTLFLEALNVGFGVFAALANPGFLVLWIGVAIAVIIIVYLLQPSISNLFTPTGTVS